MSSGKFDSLVAPQFAFRPGYQTHEVVFILRNLVEKAIEWNTPVFVLNGDLAKAYDFTLHSSVISALDSKNVPPILSSAWIREIRETSSVFVLDQRLQTKPISRTRSLLQGDPAAPAIVNATLDVPAAEFLQLASVNN